MFHLPMFYLSSPPSVCQVGEVILRKELRRHGSIVFRSPEKQVAIGGNAK